MRIHLKFSAKHRVLTLNLEVHHAHIATKQQP